MPTEETNMTKQNLDVPKSALAKAEDQMRLRKEDFIQVYANNMSIAFSSWDLGIIFGQILGEQEGKPVIEEKVKVIMTREMAKIMLKILSAHVTAFEEQFGAIRIPVLEQPEGDTEEQMIQTVVDSTRKAAKGTRRK